MKMTVTIDVDWIGDDGSLDDATRESILGAVEDRVLESVSEKLIESAEARLAPQIDAITTGMLKTWLGRKVTITSEYGRPREEGSIEELLEKRFHQFWQVTVDKDGRSDGYQRSQTRAEWMISGILAKHCKEFADDLAKKVEAQVKDVLTARLKATMGGALVDSLGVPELIKRIEAGK